MDVPQGMREWEGIISLSVGQCVIFCCQPTNGGSCNLVGRIMQFGGQQTVMVPSLELAEGTRFINHC